MYVWPNNQLLDLLNIEQPIIQAPMAGAQDAQLAIAVAQGGGLGSIPCAMLSPEQILTQFHLFKQATPAPVNLNFFCHPDLAHNREQEQQWLARLSSYYIEAGLDLNTPLPNASRSPFQAVHAELIQTLKPEVVSFHFGLPDASLLDQVKQSGALVISSATTVQEAVWLKERGCDLIIAQGYEAGGHRALFLDTRIDTQVGLMALLPQIVDATDLPVIAAGGIVDGRGITAAFALGACGAQLGTAFLFCPEAKISSLHQQALSNSTASSTALTNIFTGKPARGILNKAMLELGPISTETPDFPYAASAIAPLRSAAEHAQSSEFTPLWSGQAAALGRELPADQLVRVLAQESQGVCKQLGLAGSKYPLEKA